MQFEKTNYYCPHCGHQLVWRMHDSESITVIDVQSGNIACCCLFCKHSFYLGYIGENSEEVKQLIEYLDKQPIIETQNP